MTEKEMLEWSSKEGDAKIAWVKADETRVYQGGKLIKVGQPDVVRGAVLTGVVVNEVVNHA